MKWLVFGHRGWIGKQVVELLKENKENEVILSDNRLENRHRIEFELISLKPDRVISLTGRTHGPGFGTIDYLEQPGKLMDNVRDNLYGPVSMALLCQEHGIHYTYLGTGCIFNYNEDHPLNSDKGYSESDEPNFYGSSYSTVKGFTDRLMHQFNNVLNVRIRMPITGDESHRNLIMKLLKYSKICSIPNSMTVLPELLPLMLHMAKEGLHGTVNLTNPGVIEHNEILSMYKEIIDPTFEWKNFSLEEQDKILASGRSNNHLSTELLEKLYPNVLPIKEAVRKVLEGMKDK